ncbi:DUF5681 domain-containing protein [Rhodoferax sp.]|uniref:DUF5681 domain-containing protein n=1 Tax=Rhodoferax sp. TaxID=50421 RepID=UPI001EC97678|nr:DUF5681 domain-containing protein [Rhodoferax sp.]MBT9505506.1 hypothetical protein [Rhodoferax sp.]
MTEKRRIGRWKAGESGNPTGKTPGSGALQKLRATIAADVPEILAGLVIAAKGGDVQAARIILDRVLPPVKAIEQAVRLEFFDGDTLTAKASAVLSAAASGDVAPGQAAQLIAALGSLAKLSEVDDLAARITTLEAKHGNT